MTLTEMSVVGGILILAILLLRLLTKNSLPKITFVVLWCIAVFRLIVPYSIESSFSLYNIAPISEQTQPGEITPTGDLGQPDTPPSGIDGIIQGDEGLSGEISDGHGQVSTIDGTVPPVVDDKPVDVPGEQVTFPDKQDSPLTVFDVARLLKIIWLVGVAACAVFFSVAYIKLRMELATSLPLKDEVVLGLAERNKLIRGVRFRTSDRIQTPMTYGLICPVIVMPKIATVCNEKQLEYIIEHEYVHIKRMDILVKAALIVAACVHWFNPLVWVMLFLCNHDIELSCDEAVIRKFGRDSREEYANTLIGLAESRHGLPSLISGFSKNSLEERVKAMMKIRKMSIFAVLMAVVTVICVFAVFATSADPQDLKNDPGEQEITVPDVTEPDVTEPDVTEPDVTEPDVTEPKVTEPDVTEPDVTEPEVTEPEVTEPEVTEPKATEPEEPEVKEIVALDRSFYNYASSVERVTYNKSLLCYVDKDTDVITIKVKADGMLFYYYANSDLEFPRDEHFLVLSNTSSTPSPKYKDFATAYAKIPYKKHWESVKRGQTLTLPCLRFSCVVIYFEPKNDPHEEENIRLVNPAGDVLCITNPTLSIDCGANVETTGLEISGDPVEEINRTGGKISFVAEADGFVYAKIIYDDTLKEQPRTDGVIQSIRSENGYSECFNMIRVEKGKKYTFDLAYTIDQTADDRFGTYNYEKFMKTRYLCIQLTDGRRFYQPIVVDFEELDMSKFYGYQYRVDGRVVESSKIDLNKLYGINKDNQNETGNPPSRVK